MKTEASSFDDQKEIFFFGLLASPFIGGIGVFVWQMYYYLKYAIWDSISIIDTMKWMNFSWANNPRDWIGLHDLLSHMPTSLGLIGIGLILFIFTITNQ